MAQDVQKVLPEIVKRDGPSGMLSVTYAAVIPVLVKAVQEQQRIIERQEAQLARLENAPMRSAVFSGLKATALHVISSISLGRHDLSKNAGIGL